MSKFTTRIPVDVAEVVNNLPHGSYVYSAQLSADRTNVEVVWDNDLLVGKFQHHEFPLDLFRAAKLPPDVVATIPMEAQRIAVAEPIGAENAAPETIGVGTSDVAEKPVKRRK
jgi:hypothetical protein